MAPLFVTTTQPAGYGADAVWKRSVPTVSSLPNQAKLQYAVTIPGRIIGILLSTFVIAMVSIALIRILLHKIRCCLRRRNGEADIHALAGISTHSGSDNTASQHDAEDNGYEADSSSGRDISLVSGEGTPLEGDARPGGSDLARPRRALLRDGASTGRSTPLPPYTPPPAYSPSIPAASPYDVLERPPDGVELPT